MKLHLILFFGTIVRILLECYLEIAISCFLNLKLLIWHDSGEYSASVFTFCFLFIVIVLPFFIYKFLLESRSRLNKKSFKLKYHELFSMIKKKSNITLLYNAVFIARRLFYALMLVYLGNYPFTQIAILIILSYLNVLYVFKFQPFREKLGN